MTNNVFKKTAVGLSALFIIVANSGCASSSAIIPSTARLPHSDKLVKFGSQRGTYGINNSSEIGVVSESAFKAGIGIGTPATRDIRGQWEKFCVLITFPNKKRTQILSTWKCEVRNLKKEAERVEKLLEAERKRELKKKKRKASKIKSGLSAR